MISNDNKYTKEMNNFAEEIFGTHEDPDQIPINNQSRDKLKLIHPSSILYYEVDGKLTSWLIAIPTTKDLMQKFLDEEITERELFDLTQPADSYEALYLTSIITLPEYRNKGYAYELVKQAMKDVSDLSSLELFAWPFSKEGTKLIKKMERELGVDIKLRKPRE